MAQYNHLPIFQHTYQLTLEIHRSTHQFPREYKYTLGQKLKKIVSDLLDLIVAANSKEDKVEVLEDARLKLEQLRIHKNKKGSGRARILTLAGVGSELFHCGPAFSPVCKSQIANCESH
jgi:hypothetical protein